MADSYTALYMLACSSAPLYNALLCACHTADCLCAIVFRSGIAEGEPWSCAALTHSCMHVTLVWLLCVQCVCTGSDGADPCFHCMRSQMRLIRYHKNNCKCLKIYKASSCKCFYRLVKEFFMAPTTILFLYCSSTSPVDGQDLQQWQHCKCRRVLSLHEPDQWLHALSQLRCALECKAVVICVPPAVVPNAVQLVLELGYWFRATKADSAVHSAR
eukprot:8852-Heterococcus_DN1.PRE.2